MTPEEEAQAIEIEMELRKRKQAATPVSAEDKLRSAGSGGMDLSTIGEAGAVRKGQDPTDMIASMGIEAAGPAIGQMAGEATGPFAPIAIPVFGGLGGMAADAIVQAREGGKFSIGRMLGSGVAGAIPGGSMVKTGGRQIAKEGAKYAAGEVAGGVLESEVETGELPSAGTLAGRAAGGMIGAVAARPMAGVTLRNPEVVAREAERTALLAKRAQSLKDLRSEGIVSPPSEITKTQQGFAENLAGASLNREAAIRNAAGFQKLSREHIGLSKEPLPITQGEIDTRLREEGEPYRQIDQMGKTAKAALDDISKEVKGNPALMNDPQFMEEVGQLQLIASVDNEALKDARAEAKRLFRAADEGAAPEAFREAKEQMAKATRQEEIIDKAATLLGDQDLLDRLRQSRKMIARIHSIDESLAGGAIVNPQKLVAQKRFGIPLDGRAEQIADFAEAFPKAAKDISAVSAPTAALPRGFMAGALNKVTAGNASKLARTYLLSDFKLRDVLNPTERQGFASALARFAAESSARGRGMPR